MINYKEKYSISVEMIQAEKFEGRILHKSNIIYLSLFPLCNIPYIMSRYSIQIIFVIRLSHFQMGHPSLQNVLFVCICGPQFLSRNLVCLNNQNIFYFIYSLFLCIHCLQYSPKLIPLTPHKKGERGIKQCPQARCTVPCLKIILINLKNPAFFM